MENDDTKAQASPVQQAAQAPPDDRFFDYVSLPKEWTDWPLLPNDANASLAELSRVLRQCEAWLVLNPASFFASLVRARVLTEVGRVSEAINEFDQLVTQYSVRRYDAFRFRANAKVRIADYRGAFEDYADACTLSSSPSLGKEGRLALVGTRLDWSWAISTCPDDQLHNEPAGRGPYHGTNAKLALYLAQANWEEEEIWWPDNIFRAAASANLQDFDQAIRCLDRTDSYVYEKYRRLIAVLRAEFLQSRPYRVQFTGPAIDQDLTSLHELPHHGPVKPEEQVAGAITSLSGLRTDPNAVLQVLEGANFPLSTRARVKEWLDGLSASAILANRLRKLMDEKNWSLRDLAKETDLGHNTVGRILKRKQSPDLNTLCRIAAAFGTSPRGLMSPEVISKPLAETAASAKFIKTLKRALPNGSRHRLDGIFEGTRSPTLTTVEKLAVEADISVADLLP